MKNEYYQNLLETCPDIFADILNACFYKGESHIKPMDMKPWLPNVIHENLKQISLFQSDIFKNLLSVTKFNKKKKTIFSIFIAQSPVPYPLSPNVQFHDNAYYSTEERTKNHYPIFSIVLYLGNVGWDSTTKLSDLYPLKELDMVKEEPFHNFVINLCPVAFLPQKIREQFHSDFRLIADYLYHRQKNTIKALYEEQRHVQHAKQILEMLSLLEYEDYYSEKEQLLVSKIDTEKDIFLNTPLNYATRKSYAGAVTTVLKNCQSISQTAELLELSEEEVRELAFLHNPNIVLESFEIPEDLLNAFEGYNAYIEDL